MARYGKEMKKCIVCLVSGLMVFGAMLSVGFAQDSKRSDNRATKTSSKKRVKKSERTNEISEIEDDEDDVTVGVQTDCQRRD